MANRIQVRRDTAANWTTANPVLAAGEPALETDTGRRKTGDGTTAWTALAYVFDKTIADGIYTTPAAADAAYAPITGSTNYLAPGQLDAANAANITTPTSATATALNAAYDPKGAAATAAASKLDSTVAAATYATLAGAPVAASSVYVQRYPKAKATAISTAQSALGNRSTTPFDVLFIGDSTLEGQGATVRDFRYVNRFRDLIRSQFPTPGVAGGSNYQTAAPLQSSFPKDPLPQTLTVTSAFGLGRRNIQMVSGTSASSLVFHVVATSVKLTYLLGSLATFTYQVDAGTPVSVNVAGTRTPATTLSITGLGGTAHTITIKWETGGTINFDGLYVYNGDETRGIRVWEGGHYGYKTGDFTNVTYASDWMAHITNIQPQLVVIALGTNDAITDTSATFKSNMQTLVANVRSVITNPPSIVLVGQPQRKDTLIEPWANYLTALTQIASSDAAIDVLDLTKIMPQVSGAPANWYVDSVHPTNKGYAELARALVEFVTP